MFLFQQDQKIEAPENIWFCEDSSESFYEWFYTQYFVVNSYDVQQ